MDNNELKPNKKNVSRVAALSSQDREKLKNFFEVASKSNLQSTISLAVDLPMSCKKALEGLLFHEGYLQFSLLHGVSNLPLAIAQLSEELGLGG